MCKRSNSACKISFLLFLLTIFCFTSLASISVNGVVFDSAVVNDNARQATPSNYSCIQSGGTVTLSGQQPKSTANVTYFYNHASQASEWKFMAGINFSNLTDTNSLMGIMFYSGNLVAGAGDQGWYRLGITGNRRVYLETHNFCDPPRKDLLCTLKINVTTAYIMAKIESGMLSFFVSDAPIITGNELEVIQIGSPIYFPYSHLYGFFLEPHVTTGFERAVFNSMSIIPRNSTNGINSLNNYTVPGVSGLSDWSSITLPPGFFNTPM
jgi:hypothetical protein